MFNLSHNFNIVRAVKRDFFCDVKLRSQCGSTLCAHKVILCAASKKLEKVFTKNPDLEEYEVRNIDHDILVKLVDFVYDGKVRLNTRVEMTDFADAFTVLNMYLGPKFNAVIKSVTNLSDNSGGDGSQDTFDCETCGKKYGSKAQLTRHEREKHRVKKRVGLSYKCEQCGKEYRVCFNICI